MSHSYRLLLSFLFVGAAWAKAPGPPEAIGVGMRAGRDRAATLVRAGKLDEAAPLIGEILAFYAGHMLEPGRIYLSADSRRELEAQRGYYKVPAKVPLVWFDGSFADALHLKAFVEGARRNWDAALEALDQEALVRPNAAGAWLEKGYVLTALRRFDEAEKALGRASDMMRMLPDSVPADRAKALRGLGYLSTEKGDLAKARALYKRSLELEPRNAIALAELKYLDQLEKERKREPGGR